MKRALLKSFSWWRKRPACPASHQSRRLLDDGNRDGCPTHNRRDIFGLLGLSHQEQRRHNRMKIYELNHVAIHVKDVEASCEFYKRVLKLEPMPRPAFTFPGAWFRLGENQELHLIGERSEPVFGHNRGNHYALRVDDLN